MMPSPSVILLQEEDRRLVGFGRRFIGLGRARLPVGQCHHDRELVCPFEIVKEFQPDPIVQVSQDLVEAFSDASQRAAAAALDVKEWDTVLAKWLSRFEDGGLPSSADFVKRMRVSLASGLVTTDALARFVEELTHRIQYDLSSTVYLRLEADESDYFSGSQPKWGEARAVFAISEEVDEGAKCYALARYPAAVFHMMRVLEIGLNTLADELGVPFEHRNWENIINDIEAELRKIDKAQPPVAYRREKLHYYGEAARHFRFLKDAWRNYVMHVKESHNAGTALSVVDGVSALMRQLAVKRPWDP